MTTFLKKEFEDAGFDCEEVIEHVLLVNDFLNNKELNILFNIINNATEEDWKQEYLGNLKNFCLEKFGRDDVENLIAEGKFEVTQGWEDKNLAFRDNPISMIIRQRINNLIQKSDTTIQIDGISTFQRMQAGSQLKPHTDQHTDPSIRYAAIIYLNDNYVDGEFFFEKQKISIRPKPGSMLIFPGTDEFHHGVDFVGEGPIRYVIVGFIKEKGHYERNRY
jgi:hypothetical protein